MIVLTNPSVLIVCVKGLAAMPSRPLQNSLPHVWGEIIKTPSDRVKRQLKKSSWAPTRDEF